jgi:16S rRNA (guanine966-N2)-methyltransferase
MRVIGGEFRSRGLKALDGLETRPTPDRLREALFNVLAGRIRGAVFLDAYAGSGAVGIEALSRGATRAVFLEQNRRAVAVIRENLRSLGIEDRALVVPGRAAANLARCHAGIAFLDPPYAEEREYGRALDVLGAGDASLVIVQHAARFVPPEACGSLRRARTLTHGSNSLSFYEPPPTAPLS